MPLLIGDEPYLIVLRHAAIIERSNGHIDFLRCPSCGASKNPSLRGDVFQSGVPGDQDRTTMAGAFRAADTRQRVKAALVDVVPMLVLFFAMASIFGDVGGSDGGPNSSSTGFSFSLGGWGFIHYLALVVVYYTVSEVITGTTFGKWTVGLTVVDSEGRRPKFLPLLMRNVVRIVDFFPIFYLSGIIAIWMSPKDQRLGDRVALTHVAIQTMPYLKSSSSVEGGDNGEAESPSATGQTGSLAPRMAIAIIVVALISGISILLSPASSSNTSLDRFAEAQQHSDAGLDFGREGRFEEAIGEFDEAIRLAPELGALYVNRSEAYLYLGQFQLAIQDADEAIRLNPQLALAYNNRGAAYNELEQPDRAIKDLDQAIRLEPQLVMAYVNRTGSYGRLGQYERSIQDADAAIRLEPKISQAYLNRGATFNEMGRFERAIQDYDQAIRLEPQVALAFANRAISYTLLAKDEKAKQDIDRAVRLGVDRRALQRFIEELISQR